jgi:hypothetical protein
MPRTSPEPAAEPAGVPYDPLAWEARVASARARRAAKLASRTPLPEPSPGVPEHELAPAPQAVAAPGPPAPTPALTPGPTPVPPVVPVPAPARRRSPLGTALLVLAGVFLGGLGIGLGAALVVTGPIQLRQETLAEVTPAAQPPAPVAALLPEAASPAAVSVPVPTPEAAAALPPEPAAAAVTVPTPDPAPAAAALPEPDPAAAAESATAVAAAPEPAPSAGPLVAPVPEPIAEAAPPADAPAAAESLALPAPEVPVAAAESPEIETLGTATVEADLSMPFAVIAPRPRPAAEPSFEAAAGTAPDALLGPDGAPLIGPPPPPAALLGPVATVRIHAPVNLSRAEVDRAVAALRAQGHRIEGPHRVSFSISRSNARYFHGADAEAARAVGSALGPSARGTTVETRDFTHFSPRPPVGTVELWLAGRGAAPQSAPVAATRRPPNPIEALGRQIARIFNPNR